MEAVIDKFGRIVIPKKIRENFRLMPGSSIRIIEGKNEIVLKPVEGEPNLDEKEGIIVFTGKAMENLETKVEELRSNRNRSLGGGI